MKKQNVQKKKYLMMKAGKKITTYLDKYCIKRVNTATYSKLEILSFNIKCITSFH